VDKRNTVIGTLMLVAAFLVFFFSQRNLRQAQPSPAQIRQEVSKQAAKEAAKTGTTTATATLTPTGTAPAADEPTFMTAQADQSGAVVTRLANSFVDISFTDAGGAIREVAFRKYPAALGRPDPFIFNELHDNPMLAIVAFPGLDRETRYELVSKTDHDITYRAVLANRLEVTRHYIVEPEGAPGSDPYQIRSETTLRNLTGKPTEPLRIKVSIGTAAPSNALDNGYQLTTEYWNGKDQTLVRRASLEGGNGFLGFGASGPKAVVTGDGPVVWATVKNQFFAAILTPDDPAAAVETRRIKLLNELPDADRRAYGITGSVDFDVASLPAGGSTTLAASLYFGPKEYNRLSNTDVFKKDQDRIMDFGNFVFRFCAAILITTMRWFHSWTLNWGIAIILTTLALKILFLPLTLAQARTARRTQKIAPELKEVREKYKDNPQKQQAETMALYKKHKVNPLGGCLPMLLTIPFFFAFYRMLQSATELRFAHFLWAHDLSAPDTVASVMAPFIGPLNINVLPLLLGAVNFFQMRLTPAPTVDNAQMKLMKFMPVMFVLFYYNWPCAISLYSTVNGLFIIGQQLVVNRMADPVVAEPPRPGKPARNVTPKKR
jgi:YidC/Oxa1 family membrane protein insertase